MNFSSMIHPRHKVLDPVYLVTLVAKIFDLAYMSDDYSTFTDPFSFISVPRFHGMPLPSQGNRTVHVSC